jgi:hypothetical protein
MTQLNNAMKNIAFIVLFVATTTELLAQLTFRNPNPLLSPINSTLQQSNVQADVGGNAFQQNTWLLRTAGSPGWPSVHWVDGISVDGTYITPTTARTWWRRDAVNATHFWGDMGNTWMTLQWGKLGIGTTTPDELLTVKGTIHCREVKVDLNGAVGPDYVFEKNYELPDLTTVEKYILANKHLPEVPSANEMEANGVKLLEMNLLLLKKVEELTLYVIEQQKKIEILERTK